jgi:hypothetical protein
MNTKTQSNSLTKITLYLNTDDSEYVRSAYQMFSADRLARGLPTVSMSRFCKSLMIEALGSDEELIIL